MSFADLRRAARALRCLGRCRSCERHRRHRARRRQFDRGRPPAGAPRARAAAGRDQHFAAFVLQAGQPGCAHRLVRDRCRRSTRSPVLLLRHPVNERRVVPDRSAPRSKRLHGSRILPASSSRISTSSPIAAASTSPAIGSICPGARTKRCWRRSQPEHVARWVRPTTGRRGCTST